MLICVDLDGTLLDTIPANAASYRAALEEQGFTVTDEYYAQYCNGGYYKQFLRPLMGGDPAPEAVERVHDRKKELYSSCLPMVRPNTSLLAILQAMKAAGHDLACVTTGSRKNATEVLEYFHCADWFGVFITGEELCLMPRRGCCPQQARPRGLPESHGAFRRYPGGNDDLRGFRPRP